MATPKPPTAQTFYKQPWESIPIGVDFSKVMSSSEEISLEDSTVIAEDVNGDDASNILDNDELAVGTSDADDISTTPKTNALLTTRIQAGTVALSKYKITYRAVTTLSNQFEKDIYMSIKDI